MNEIDVQIKTEDSRYVIVYGVINGKMVSRKEGFTHEDKKSFLYTVRKAVDSAIKSSCVPVPGDIVTLSRNYSFTGEGVRSAICWAASRSDMEISRHCLAKLNVFAITFSNEPYEVIFADEEFAAISKNTEGSIVRIVPTDCLK